MADIRNPRLLYLKAALLLTAGLVAAGILLLENASFRFAALLLITIWSFCRAYYFAFYVIEHYADPSFRFAGLFSFLRYALKRNRGDAPNSGNP
jgi:hypothetical protein